jgi:hypothetical protein
LRYDSPVRLEPRYLALAACGGTAFVSRRLAR